MEYYEPPARLRQLFLYRGLEVFVANESEFDEDAVRAALEKVNAQALKYPGMRGLVLGAGPYTRTRLRTFFEEVVRPGTYRFSAPSQEVRYPNGSVVIFGDARDLQRFVTAELDTIYVHDAEALGERRWEDMQTRLRNGVVPYQQIIGGVRDWAARRVAEGRAVRV